MFTPSEKSTAATTASAEKSTGAWRLSENSPGVAGAGLEAAKSETAMKSSVSISRHDKGSADLKRTTTDSRRRAPR
ncbi:hypothetical protein, partial [Nannocystis pusilla]|uniref:hypothetical protein n=1 Tax=Nannocystis pusilla TaxID=889268 RepID=UPI003B7757A3